MKNVVKVFAVVVAFLVIGSVSAQTKAVVVLKSNTSAVVEIEDFRSGIISTTIGGISSEDVSRVVFKNYSNSVQDLYANLAKSGVKVNFDDKSELFDLPNTAASEITLPSFKEIEIANKYVDSRKAGRRLIRASKSGMLGVALPIIGSAVTIATGGTAPLLVGGVAGLIFQIDAWSKVAKAGEVLDLEIQSLRDSKK